MAQTTTGVSGGRMFMYSGITITGGPTMILADAGSRAGVLQAGFMGDFTEEEAMAAAAMEDDAQTIEIL